jgi:hypothetical protein
MRPPVPAVREQAAQATLSICSEHYVRRIHG